MKSLSDIPKVGTATPPTTDSASVLLLRESTGGHRQRRVGLHHIAFLRGYFEGIDVAVLADQYLALGRDKKKGQAARRWIVEALVAAARKQGDAVGARLLKLPAGALPELADDLATETVDLEAFRERVDPEGVYSESELVALLSASITAASTQPDAQTRRAQRNTRLRHRQRALLERLEHALAEPPRAHHPLRDWLDAALATRLEDAGLQTFSELNDFISARGYRWYSRIPRVGEQAALRVLRWIDRNAADLGLTFPEHARLPRDKWPAMLLHKMQWRRTTPRDAIAPIEFFAPRDPGARSDRDLLVQWLMRFKSQANTFRAYRIQAERLLLWATLERRIRLSAMTPEDASAFFAFISRPDLPLEWQGPKAERHTDAWRPIQKPPSSNSIAVARRILKLAFDHLNACGQGATNPFAAAINASGSNMQTIIEGQTLDRAPNPIASSIDVTTLSSSQIHPRKVRATALIAHQEGALQTASRATPTEAPEDGARISSSAAPNVATRLRYLRLAVVRALLNATAWPLSILVQLRAEHLHKAAMVGKEMSGAYLLFHDGKRSRRAHLDRTALRLMADYLSSRESVMGGSLGECFFLIGRHAHEAKDPPSPISPNVMARALARYHRNDGPLAIGGSRPDHVNDRACTQSEPSHTNFRALKRHARQKLRARTSSPEAFEGAGECAMSPIPVNLRAFSANSLT